MREENHKETNRSVCLYIFIEIDCTKYRDLSIANGSHSISLNMDIFVFFRAPIEFHKNAKYLLQHNIIKAVR